ncbi:MAG: CPBP family intramembrane metalloprotease [Acidobacteria bacterium]|nr:CPBP family intramembrane metalloprotease [Acidobacteriota bacterium]
MEETSSSASKLFGLLVRGGLFLIFIRFGGGLFGVLLYWLFDSILVASAMSLFFAAVVASAFVVRTFERGRLEDIGMAWGRDSLRHLWIGLALGAGAGLLVMLGPVAAGAASVIPATEAANAFTPGKFVFVSVILLFGAVGEELMFRGYAFQILLREYGPWWVIVPFGALFALAHLDNPGMSWLGIANTGLWGVLLGYSFFRSGDLWLPIGLHFGWNWVLPLFGVNLSGFTMGLTGYTLRWSAGALWSGGAYGVEAGVPATAVVFGVGILLWKLRLERQPAPLLEQSS